MCLCPHLCVLYCDCELKQSYWQHCLHHSCSVCSKRFFYLDNATQYNTRNFCAPFILETYYEGASESFPYAVQKKFSFKSITKCNESLCQVAHIFVKKIILKNIFVLWIAVFNDFDIVIFKHIFYFFNFFVSGFTCTKQLWYTLNVICGNIPCDLC